MTASKILGADGLPLVVNGQASGHITGREQVLQYFRGQRMARANYDAARDTEEYRRHWANADSLDPDSANNRAVRHKLMRRSRYEGGSNGYYKGIQRTHANMVWGIGPKLRMLTRNKNFNQLVEREFYTWAKRVQLRRKGWCMTFARCGDGETFAVLRTNPLLGNGVQLDLMPIEGEQCQTPYLPTVETGYIDGIKFDEFNNIQWYDVLPSHPGASVSVIGNNPIRIPPQNMLHWFKLERAGTHRSVPELTATLNLGASSRRFREATLAKAESQADFTVMLKSLYEPSEEERYQDGSGGAGMDAFEIEKRMAVTLPNTLDPVQLRNDTPSDQYADFNRTHVSETGAPISQPYNVSAKDSSTYSFASGKLDVLCYRSEINVEREDCNDLVLDPMFSEWFSEWSLINRGAMTEPEDTGPDHQWDWPAHPVIDSESENRARDTALKNGTETIREAYTAQGRDYEDELQVMAEDWFGENTAANIDKVRKINLLRNIPAHALEIVASIAGIEIPQPAAAPTTKPTGGNNRVKQTNGQVSR